MKKASAVSLDSTIITVRKRKISLEHLLLAIILLFGLFLRLYELGSVPFWVDESISSIASLNILEKGLPILDSGYYYGGATVFHYTQALSFLIFGTNDFAARLPSVLFGMLTIVLAYFIGKEYSRTGGIMAAALCAIFFLEVSYSRQARFYQLFQLAFFATIYFIYRAFKAKDDKKASTRSIYTAALSFIIAVDTQIGGVVLAPLFAWYFISSAKGSYADKLKSITNNKGILILLILISAITAYNVWEAMHMSVGPLDIILNRVITYFSDITIRKHIIPFAVAGLIWSFLKNRTPTSLVLLPCVLLAIAVLMLDVYATRYMYFLIFPLVAFTSLLFAFLYERFGRIMLLPLAFLILVPSNLFFPATFSNAILPLGLDYTDISIPRIDLKSLPASLLAELKDPSVVIVTYFSPPVEWYIKKPTYVLPFSMTGRGSDELSYNSSGTFVDRYSGVPIINQTNQFPPRPYYLIEQSFAISKLKPDQVQLLNAAKGNYTSVYENNEVNIYSCR